MRLTYLWIQHFGKLKEKEIILEDGINVIYGPNESGKSTLHAFIRGMLFGMARYRGRASKTDPYTRYEPWERPVDYAGMMRFAEGEKEFRIDRNFYRGDVRESLICEMDGEQLSIAHGDLQMLLGGISESVYDNTVSVGQLRSETDEGMVRELQNHMSNYENTGTGDVDVQRAGEKLKKKKKEWESKICDLELRRKRRVEELENQIAYIQQEKGSLAERLEKVRSEKQEYEQRKAQMADRIEREKALPREQKRQTEKEAAGRHASQAVLWVWGMILGLAFLAAAVWNPLDLKIGVQIALGAVGAGTAVLCAGQMKRKEKQEIPLASQAAADPWEAYQKQLIRLQESISRLYGQEDALLVQLEDKTTVIQNLLERREELGQKPQEITNCEIEIQSLELAMEVLGKLSGGIRRRIGQRLQGRMEEILSEITEGKYNRISLDADMKISLYEWNRQVSLHQLSRGTVEQVYFALRMAVSEVLCEEQMPVILDDVFAMYDEKRLMQTLRWLSGRGGQVILLTCHRREGELLRQMGIRSHVINMEEESC